MAEIGRLNRLRVIREASFGLYLDGQGRIALPTPLREYAGIDDELSYEFLSERLSDFDEFIEQIEMQC